MKKLLVISSAPATEVGRKFYLDKKFCEGMRFYAKAWNGRVEAVLYRRDARFDFGELYEASELPFDLRLLGADEVVSSSTIEGAGVVLCSGDNHRLLHLPQLRLGRDPAIVYTIEYVPETRRKIVFLDRTASFPKKLYTWAWTVAQERRRRAAFRLCNGLQANGYPAMAAYGPLNANTLLYLDNRIGESLFVTGEQTAARRDRLLSGRPLRILHSGRLEPMKGAQDLVPIARRLADLGVAFEMEIFGAGSLAGEIRTRIGSEGLSDRVRLNAPVDFESELVPYARREADIFLSCHRHSDPSCTYLESMGCGLPIVGYSNRMWQGLLEDSGAGWIAPLGDWRAISDVIARIAGRREEIVAKAENAVAFAANHLFEAEFAQRIAHLKSLT